MATSSWFSTSTSSQLVAIQSRSPSSARTQGLPPLKDGVVLQSGWSLQSKSCRTRCHSSTGGVASQLWRRPLVEMGRRKKKMVVAVSRSGEVQHDAGDVKYDRKSELIAFDETKSGVKGLVDSGVTRVPKIFHLPPESIDKNQVKKITSNDNELIFPIIDLIGLIGEEDPVQRKALVDQVRDASESWGFFQVVNHGIPLSTMEEMIKGVRSFHEQDTEVKKQWYTRDLTKPTVYNSNFDLYTAPAANWRDTCYCSMAPVTPKPEELPEVFRDIMMECSERVMKLGNTLFELLSEALGLDPNYLKDIDCTEGLAVLGHYYPACPQPELTIGTNKHADNDFLTILLQDEIGGLQVLHHNHWFDVPPLPGAIVVNIGDLLQLITNDKFKSVEHRVLANHVGPRVIVACFFTTGSTETLKLYGPINELLTTENPPRYKKITVVEYLAHFEGKGLDGKSALSHFKL